MTESNPQHIALLRSFGNLLFRPFYKHFVPAGLIMVVVVFCSALIIGCQTIAVEPVALAPDDMCAFCRMSISEKRYAAQVIDSDGQAFKFDDIGCMLNFIKQKRNQNEVRAYFVMDFDRREWIKAENAFYVRSSELATPMNGGIIAFATQSGAQQATNKYHGTLLRFEALSK